MGHKDDLLRWTILLDVTPQIVKILLEVKLIGVSAVRERFPLICRKRPIFLLLLKSLHAASKTSHNKIIPELENAPIDISVHI